MMKRSELFLVVVQLIFASVVVLGSIYSAFILRPHVATPQVLGVKTDMSHVDFVQYNFDSFFVADTSVLKNSNTIKLIVSLKPIDQGVYILGHISLSKFGNYTISVLPIEFPDKYLSLYVSSSSNQVLLDYPKEDFFTVTGKQDLEIKIKAQVNINTNTSFVIVITKAD